MVRSNKHFLEVVLLEGNCCFCVLLGGMGNGGFQGHNNGGGRGGFQGNNNGRGGFNPGGRGGRGGMGGRGGGFNRGGNHQQQ